MLRSALLYLSEKKEIQKWIMGNAFSRKSALRFVAGEGRREAVEAARALQGAGITATIDFLGENTTQESEARATLEEYLALLDQFHASAVPAHVSIKLTALGLDISRHLCEEAVDLICRRAAEIGSFVRVDMEGSKYTQATIDIFQGALAKHGNVGMAIQSYLRRTAADVEALLARGGRFRLCKGAYKEPPEIAFQDKAEVDASYVKLMKRMMTSGLYHGLATHDPAIIEEAQRFARERGVDRDAFEFQMLYGIRR
ncbi:MAG: proline dehydrogenase family protein, partial [Candidatus Wallbacteria bacterium]|nr:proline dehydrogenase family protein [Candidatus Wallbacteria bacterium]